MDMVTINNVKKLSFSELYCHMVAMNTNNQNNYNDIDIAISFYFLKNLVRRNELDGRLYSDLRNKAINNIINDFETIYKFIFNVAKNKCLDMIYCNVYRFKHFNHKHTIEIEETIMSPFKPYLPIIYEKYHEQMFNKCQKGYLNILMMFFLFQEYFTDKYFSFFIKKMMKCKTFEYIEYCLEFHRYLPDKYKNDLNALVLLKKL